MFIRFGKWQNWKFGITSVGCNHCVVPYSILYISTSINVLLLVGICNNVHIHHGWMGYVYKEISYR